MAEANNQPAPAGASQADNSAAVNGTGTQQGSDPAWINHVPENLREEAKKSYMFEADYRKKTSELAEQRKTWEEKERQYAEKDKNWQQFQYQYEPFRAQIEKNWDKIAPILQGVAQQQAAQNGIQNQDPFQDYDLLPPQEQAKRLAEHIKSQISQSYDQRLTESQKAQNEKLENYANMLRNYLTIQTEAYDRKFKNPDLNIQEFLKKALEIQNGGVNPLELAYSSLTNEATQKRQQEEWMKKGAEEERLKLQNQQQPTGALRNSMIPNFTAKPQSRQQVQEAVRNESLKAGRTWST